jgi:hypothetical protein
MLKLLQILSELQKINLDINGILLVKICLEILIILLLLKSEHNLTQFVDPEDVNLLIRENLLDIQLTIQYQAMVKILI